MRRFAFSYPHAASPAAVVAIAAPASRVAEQMLDADPQETDTAEAFEVGGQGLITSAASEGTVYDNVKRFQGMPSDDPNTVAASLMFFLFFFVFVACLRASDH